MLDTLGHIRVGEAEYPIAFTLNVMEAIQEQYGSMKKWGEAVQPKDEEPRIKDLIWTYKEFLNEGIDIENEESAEAKPLLTEKQVGRLISNVGLVEAIKVMQNITTKSTKGSSEDNPNLKTVQNQTNQ